MLEIKRNIPAPIKGKLDHVAVCDLPGFVEFLDGTSSRSHKGSDWHGGMSFKQSRDCVAKGDMSGVEASDSFLRSIEHLSPQTKAWRTIAAVEGGFPIVTAFLAGHPLSMRRRERTMSDTAPLAVFAEICGSASFSADQLRARGSAILALVRALSGVRPVELWTIIAFGNPDSRASVCVRLDTAPLDLARAAHMLTHPSVLRVLGFNSLQERLLDGYWNGGWAFNDVDAHRHCARETYVRLLSPGSEALYMPPIYTTDDSIENPVKWLTDHLKTYGGLADE